MGVPELRPDVLYSPPENPASGIKTGRQGAPSPRLTFGVSNTLYMGKSRPITSVLVIELEVVEPVEIVA